MKNFISALFLMLVTVTGIKSQAVIARQSSGHTTFRYINPDNVNGQYDGARIQEAILACSAGDTLYLPGETFQLASNITIDRKVVIIGTGINPDSAMNVQGANVTRLNSINNTNKIIYFDGTGANNSELHGLSLGEEVIVTIGSTQALQNVSGLKFNRCEFGWFVNLGYNPNTTSTANNILFKNCIFRRSVDVRKASNVSLISNVIETAGGIGSIERGVASTIVANNIIFNYDPSQYSIGVQYNNNIFTRNNTTSFNVTENGNFYNNLWLFTSGGTLTFSGTTNQANNQVNAVTGIFTTSGASLTAFSFANNYHLNTGHANYTTYNNMGGAGPVGLFGSATNYWKDGILPFNPHWVAFPNGNLGYTNNGLINVNIKAAAQQE